MSIRGSIGPSLRGSIRGGVRNGTPPALSYDGLMYVEPTSYNSYPGDQDLINLVQNPNDGLDSSAYNLQLGNSGTTANDPEFIGELGSFASSFEYNGANARITIPSNTQFIDDIHCTTVMDLECGIVIALRWPPSVNTGLYYLCGTTNTAARFGFQLAYDADDQRIRFRQSSGTGSYAITDIGAGLIDFTSGEWIYLAFSFEKTNAFDGNYRMVFNQQEFSGALTPFQVCNDPANNEFQISGVSGSSLMPNESRTKSFVLLDRYLGFDEMEQLRLYFSTLHGEPYES